MVILTILAASLPLLYWWRFKDTRLDRDYTPYAYLGVFGGGWLKGAHRDIKPPLIHWGYWVWFGIVSRLKLRLNQKVRLFSAVGASLTCLMIGLNGNPSSSILLALLLVSPYLWAHMASTEWMTVALLALTVGLDTSIGNTATLAILGLLPLVNQKNILLVVPVAWALGISLVPTTLAVLFAPSMGLLIYILANKRARKWLWEIPKKMGKARALRTHTLKQLHLLTPFLFKLCVLLPIIDPRSPWALVLLIAAVLTISVKQIVPHHLILLAFPLAMCAEPNALFFVAWGILWVLQDWPIWNNPELIYPLTFRDRGNVIRHYGELLGDSDEVVEWLKENTKEGEAIWVNGFENQIYLEANRPSAMLTICEATDVQEEFEKPRVIVHCVNGRQDFNYEGYEHRLITPRGLFTVMERKSKIWMP